MIELDYPKAGYGILQMKVGQKCDVINCKLPAVITFSQADRDGNRKYCHDHRPGMPQKSKPRYCSECNQIIK